MTVVQAYICAKHYQVKLLLLELLVLVVLGSGAHLLGCLGLWGSYWWDCCSHRKENSTAVPILQHLFQPGRADLPKIHDLAANVRVLVTQGISVNSSYSSDVQVCLSSNPKKLSSK